MQKITGIKGTICKVTLSIFYITVYDVPESIRVIAIKYKHETGMDHDAAFRDIMKQKFVA